MSNLTIVQSNQLVEASYSLTLDEMRLICLASTKVDSRKANIGEIRIDVTEYIQAYSLSSKHAYTDLRSAVKSIMRKPIRLFDGNEVVELAWITMNRYRITDGSHVIIKFSPEISPYLFELKERFTAINFEYAARLNTPFSFRLYQWLYKAKKLNKHKLGETVCVILDLEWMKIQSGLDGKYNDWRKFNERMLTPAVEKINCNTDLSVVWTPIKTGKKVTRVQFNYVVEEATQTKPLRPRLYRRPKVKPGSHAEGEWMRKNEALLVNYEKELKRYDRNLKLDLADVRRLIEIYKARGECSEIHEPYQARVKELKQRTTKAR